MINKSGVYKITNLVNNKFYIGSSVNIKTRWNEHLNDLKKSQHGNVYLQRSYFKYGVLNLKFEIIEFCEKENCIQREQYYIDNLKPDYNMCKIAGSTYRNPTIIKAVNLYDFTGTLVKKFNSIIECAEYLNCDSSTISSCAKGNKNVTVKSHFVLFDNSATVEAILERLEKIKISKFNKASYSRTQSIEVEQFSLDGKKLKVYPSVSSVAKIFKSSYTKIMKACKNDIVYKNYIWKLKTEMTHA